MYDVTYTKPLQKNTIDYCSTLILRSKQTTEAMKVMCFLCPNIYILVVNNVATYVQKSMEKRNIVFYT